MRIAHLSDIHFGAEVPGLVEATLARVHELDPGLVVISGDFTMAGRRREYEAARDFVRAVSAPVVATPGNHDMPVYNLLERFVSPFGRYRKYIGAHCAGEFVEGSCAVLALNSARPMNFTLNWSHGFLSKRQVARADAFFARNASSRFRALVVHHPFEIPEDLPAFRVIGRSEEMLGVLARRGVHAVLCGHLHRQWVGTRAVSLDAGSHNISLVQVGSPCTHRVRNQPNAFVVMDVGEREVVITEQVESGGVFVGGEGRVLCAV